MQRTGVAELDVPPAESALGDEFASYPASIRSILAELEDPTEALNRKYTIDPRVISAACDGGSNMVKAMDILGIPRSHCMNHVLNLLVNDALKFSGFYLAWSHSRKVIKLSRNSGIQRKNFELLTATHDGMSKSLKDTCPTRWNNSFEAIKRLLECWNDLSSWVRNFFEAKPGPLGQTKEEAKENALKVISEANRLNLAMACCFFG